MRVFRAQLGLICVWQIQVWPCLSVSSMSNASSTILTLDRMDFDAIYQQINLNLSRKLAHLSTSEPRGVTKTPLPESFACLFYPQRTFGNPLPTFPQSFASRVHKNRDFSCCGEISLPLNAGTSRVPPRVLAVWAKTLQGQILKSANTKYHYSYLFF